MNITKHNCEAVFLDYYEKILSPVEVAEVLFFLEENPEMKEVFESYEAICLEHEKVNFPDKESLKKKYSAEEIAAILSSDISPINCEQFFIANAEGILSSKQKENLNFFLLQYPELKKEHELFLQCRLSAEKISFEEKESLKKGVITKENREEYFVRSIEKDLNSSEQQALNMFLSKHYEFKKEFELFAKAILPVEAISFENKSSLKKRERKPVFVSIFSQRTTYYAAAAAILLLVGLFFIFKNDGTDKTFVADKTNPASKTIVNVKKESAEVPIMESEQKTVPQVNNESGNSQQVSVKKKSSSSPQTEVKQEEKQLQPIIFEDNQNLVAEKEAEKPTMMEEQVSVPSGEVIAEKKQEEKKEDGVNEAQAIASAATPKSNNDYQTLGSFARRKVKAVLGIKESTECETADKLTVWDLAMAAKGGIQNLIGTKAIDINKVCDGTGDSEYVFTAGNFEISRNASK